MEMEGVVRHQKDTLSKQDVCRAQGVRGTQRQHDTRSIFERKRRDLARVDEQRRQPQARHGLNDGSYPPDSPDEPTSGQPTSKERWQDR